MSFDLGQILVPDALVVAGVIVAGVAYMYTIGRYAFVPTLVAMLFAGVVTAFAPYHGHIPIQMNVDLEAPLVFGVVFFAGVWVFRRQAYFQPSSIPDGYEIPVCGVLLAGVLLTLLGLTVPSSMFTVSTPMIQKLFIADLARTLWLLSPGVVLAVMRG